MSVSITSKASSDVVRNVWSGLSHSGEESGKGWMVICPVSEVVRDGSNVVNLGRRDVPNGDAEDEEEAEGSSSSSRYHARAFADARVVSLGPASIDRSVVSSEV